MYEISCSHFDLLDQQIFKVLASVQPVYARDFNVWKKTIATISTIIHCYNQFDIFPSQERIVFCFS